MKITFFFAWYDCWIGFFYDRAKKVLYMTFPPMCVFKIDFDPDPDLTDIPPPGSRKPVRKW